MFTEGRSRWTEPGINCFPKIPVEREKPLPKQPGVVDGEDENRLLVVFYFCRAKIIS